MTSTGRRSWSSTYRVSSASRQQRIVRMILRADDPAIRALGTERDGEHLVVVECLSANGEMRTRRLIFTLDPVAERLSTVRPTDEVAAPAPPPARRRARLAVPQRLLGLAVLLRGMF